MPEEPLNNEQQPQPTPHFDTFSGRNNEISQQPEPASTTNNNPVNSFFEPKPEPEVVNNQTASAPETSAGPIPLQDGPMTTVFAPTSAVNPEQTRVSDTLAPQQPITQVVSSEKPKWFRRKKFIIGIIVAVLIAIIAGGSAFAYISYYQSPQKVISDSIINVVTAKSLIFTGTINFDSSQGKASIVITSKTANATGSFDAVFNMTYGGKTYSINGSALFDGSGDLYFKVGNLAGIVVQAETSFGISQSSSFSTDVNKLVARIDDTWVKITSKDLKQYSTDTATTYTCLNDTIKKFKNDKSEINEVTDIYTKNPFIVVNKNLGQVGGSFGYQINVSNKKLKLFLDSFKNSKIYKTMHSCDNTFVIDTSNMNTKDETNKNSKVKLWVDAWSHQITKLEVNGTDSGTTISATILPKFNQAVTITAPKTSITLTQLQSDIQELTTSMQSGSQL
jgi:hypothetical protein